MEKKNSLKWFFILRFVIIMICIYVCEEVITLFNSSVLLPGLVQLFELQQVEINGRGNILAFLIQMLLYSAAELLPEGMTLGIQKLLENAMGNSLSFSVDSPLYQGGWGILLWVLLLGIFLISLGLSILPLSLIHI